MAHIIMHRRGAYNIWSTVMDAPIFAQAMTDAQFLAYFKEQFGQQGLRAARWGISTARKSGTSSDVYKSLRDLVSGNRVGPDESELSFDDFVAAYLTLPKQASKRKKK